MKKIKASSSVAKGFITQRSSHVLALGFGAGLSPWMPGTMGTLVGIPLAWMLALMPWPVACAVLLGLTVLGVQLCTVTAEALGEHDHAAIVYDEIIGYAWVMVLLPWSWPNVIYAFLAFRFFDIIKPWPIGWCDRVVLGGLGIMLDDLLAAAYAWGLIVAVQYWFG